MFSKVLVFLVVAATAVLSVSSNNFARGISNKQNFHHHVIINVGDAAKNYSGSIIGEEWILTSKSCVLDNTEFKIYLDPYNTDHSSAIVLKKPVIHEYPTLFDDIALIRLPLKLKIQKDYFSAASIWMEPFVNLKLAHMPGVDNSTKNYGGLTYGTYQRAKDDDCELTFADIYDRDSQICIKAVPYIQNTIDCTQAYGTGLLVDWPKQTSLVGIFSSAVRCDSNLEFLGIVTNVGKYASWLDEIMSIDDF